MKLMPCPLNGPRNIQEFICAGEVQPLPDADASGAVWADYTFMQNNIAGIVREWWMHVPTSYWFVAERDTRTDEVIRTYAPNALPQSAEQE